MTPPEKSESMHDDLGFVLPAAAKPGTGRVTTLIVLGLALIAGAFLFGYLPRQQQSATLAHRTGVDAAAAPTVDVIVPKRTQSSRPVTLSASLQPLAETVLYSRANGYVERFNVDMGERVKADQLLAVIETPELDQQLDQARAQLLQAQAALGQAEAHRDYAKTSLERFERLRPAGVASQQELDQRASDAKVSEANVVAAAASIEVARADVRRLLQLQSFARVTAPFAGIVTQRNIERGALVTAGNSTPLFKLSATDPMRVFVQVPQDLAVSVRVGTKAKVSLREYPGRVFEGEIAHVAGALDPATRTMTAEIRVANPKNELLAGMYAEASLPLTVARPILEIPATTLFNDGRGLRVAIVDAQDIVHMQPIVLERDTGATLQIASGLRGDERVIKLANAALREGSKVRVRNPGP